LFTILLLFSPLVLSHEGHDHDHDHEHAHGDSHVVVLGDDTFEDKILSTDYVFVEFYAPWCGHCKRLEPEYEIVATNFKDDENVVIAKVDATQHVGVSTKYAIRGYPTLKLFVKGNPVEYEGGRTADEITQWLKKKSGPATLHITDQEAYDAFVAQSGTKIVAYISDTTLESWTTAASSGKLDDFALAHVTDGSFIGEREVNSAIILKPEEEPVVYSGSFDTEALVSWAQAEGYPLVDELAQKIWQRSTTSRKPLLAIFIKEKSEENDQLVQTIAQKFKGTILTSYSTAGPLAERWGASGKVLPTAILVKWVELDPKMIIYDEDSSPFTVETGEEFVESALKDEYKTYRKSEPIPETNDQPVKIVVGKNFDDIVLSTEKDVFVEFYAPWCGHCKNLAPVWDQLGEAFEDVPSVTIAKMDATANAAPEHLEIKGFPTLIFFPADNKAGIPYSGERDLENLREFVKTHASHSIKKEEL